MGIMTLQIQLLGNFTLFRDGEPIDDKAWRSRQARTILKILLVQPGAVVTADRLIDYLWPDEDEPVARRRLHVRISDLRRALPHPSPILTVDGGYRFDIDGDCWLDVAAFEQWVENGRFHQEKNELTKAIAAYKKASELYKGEFLAEDLYESWAAAPRERLRELHLNTLTELAECYALQGRYRRAITLGQRVLALDPVREAMYVRLMLYHYYAGERTQSLDVYERCRQLLAAELDVEPLPETSGMMRQIRDGALWRDDDAPRYPPPIYQGRLFETPYSLGNPPLVGRKREYAWLVKQWQEPQTRLIFLEGEAGIGKTHLLQAFANYAAAQNSIMLRSRLAQEEQRPYALIIAALQPLLTAAIAAQLTTADRRVLAALWPDLAAQEEVTPPDLEPKQARLRLWEAVETAVALALPNGGVWMVDDAHRARAASLELLARLTSRLTILLAYRGGEADGGHPLRRIAPAVGKTATLTLTPLPQTAVSDLLVRLAQSELPSLANRIVAQSEGNPLFVIALLQHMFEEGALYVDDNGRWRQTGDQKGDRAISLPPTIRQTVEARLRRLNRTQRQIFDMAAVLGGEFDFDLLRSVSRESETGLLDLLDGLLDADLLIEPRVHGRKEFAIAHDYYAEVACDTLPTVRRRHLHRRAGDAIETLYADALAPHYTELERHFHQAQQPERERHYARLAGEQAAAQFANEEAVAHLSRALELTPIEEAAGRFDLLLAREKVLDLMGDREAQRQDLAAMAALAAELSVIRQAELSLRQATFAWAQSDFPQTIAIAQKAARLAQQCGAAHRSDATKIEAAAYLLWGKIESDQAAAQVTLRKARRLAQEAHLRGMEGTIVRCLGNSCYWQGNYAASKRYFADALAIHQEVGDRRGEVSALNNLGYLAHLQGELTTAVADYENALTAAQKIGDRLGEGVLSSNVAALHLSLGNFDMARHYGETGLTIRREVQDVEGVGCTLRLLGEVARQEGRRDEAKSLCQQSADLLQACNPREYGNTLDTLGLLQLDLGDYEAAEAYFMQALELIRAAESPDVCRELAHLGRLYYLRGDYEQAGEYGRQALDQSGDDLQTRALALTILGHVAAMVGETAVAVQSYEQALALRQKMGQTHLAKELELALATLVKR